MYYEDEWEDDYEDYEDYCSCCGMHWNFCYCPPAYEWIGVACTCGAALDACGDCPYCDYPTSDDQELLNWLPGIGE